MFALLVLAYLWPVLIGGRTLAPTALLYVVTPWQQAAPPGFESYLNLELGDVPFTYYPWNLLARELIHAGTFPAWNPYAFAGTPLFANVEVAWLSPFSLPLWLLPLHYALGLAAALKLWVAGFGTYLLARELRLGFWPGVLAGVSFALCGFDVVWLAHGVHVSVAVLLPWMLWLVERIVRRGRSADGLALVAIVAIALTGGHPGTQLHVLTATALYALVRAGLSGDIAWRERLRRVGLIAAATATGALLTAVVLLPAHQAAVETIGEGIRRNGGLAFPGANMHLDVLRTALFPDWWGRPSGLVSGPANYKERTFYAGGVALVLAVLALLSAGGWRRKAPFALLGAVGLAVPVHAPGVYQLVTRAPLLDQVQNQRILLWFLLAVAILAGFGLQSVLDAETRRRHVWSVFAGALLAGLVALVTLHVERRQWGQGFHYLLHRSGEWRPPVTALGSIGWWLLLVAALVPILLLARRRPERTALVGCLVVLLAALDMLHFAHGYQPMGPATRIVPPPTPAVAFLQRHAAEGRIAGVGLALGADLATVYHLRDARGRDAPQPSLRFSRLWEAISPIAGSYTLTELGAINPRALGVLGAHYVIADPKARTSTAGLSSVYRGPDATIYANTFAMGRAIVAADVLVADGEDQELAAVAQQGFDPRRDAVVRRDELDTAGLPDSGAGGTVHVVSEANAEVTLRARLPRAGLVVLDDAWAPGWTVEVDDRPARVLRTDMVLRGVVVPAGTHEVVWRYRVPGLRMGLALSATGLLVMLAWAGWVTVATRARRRGV